MDNIEENFKGGCVPDPIDDRDFIFEKTLGAGELMTEDEWKHGYNIETVLNFKLPVKNQFGSYSCVGQAWSYYKAVLDRVETGKYEEESAKSIYSQISLGHSKGAYIRDGGKLIQDWGITLESDVKSLKDNGTTDEDFMIDKSWLNPNITNKARILQGKDYRVITGIGIDVFARAIKDNYGVVGGVEGTNNGTWESLEPQPPLDTTPQSQLWGHALYFCGFGVDDKGKYLLTPNSWGNLGGFQKIRENYFTNSNRWIFNPWTITDKINNLITDDMIFKKEKNSPHIYLINEEYKTKIMVSCEEALNALRGKYEEVDNLDSYTPNGTFVWVPYIIS